MHLSVLETTPEVVRAGYACPCGCQPVVAYTRGGPDVTEGCCCGNQFAVGPRASGALPEREGFRPETQQFVTPWGQRVEAAWSIGPSVHATPIDEHDRADPTPERSTAEAVDPVCGMAVEPATAVGKGLHSIHAGRAYYFCGKGCQLEFDEDPGHYLDPDYLPSM